MNYRILGKTNYKISEVSFGGWAIGGTWGDVDDTTSMEALEKAVEMGINFFDTADVYGDGRSERLIGKLAKSKKDRIYIATKAGRRIDPHVPEGYKIETIRSHIERSLKNLNVDCLDLVQLHCPPTPVYENEELFYGLSQLKKEGLIAHFGVSVEKMEEAMTAMKYDELASIQLIYNMFRLKPEDQVLSTAMAKNVGIIARVPLASGMLTGKMTKDTVFAKDDHRSFNRHGEAFDKGETFSGVDYELGLQAVEELKKLKPAEMTMAQFALKWILMNDAVSCVIPGGKNKTQVTQNTEASAFAGLSPETMQQVKNIYDKYIRGSVHHLW
ncbi:MAG: aldo/keto reductase [Clostridia bacterium]|nr:aldo/keto reductase [Clostridia bacterium]